MNNPPRLYKKRYIPMEEVHLKDDEIISLEPERIVTRWRTLKPRGDFAKGVSCYFIDRGFKVSRFIRADGSTLYYYCDIIKTLRPERDAYVFCDLLADVVIYPDGAVRVLDVGEISQALREGLICMDDAMLALDTLAALLEEVYSGGFDCLKALVDSVDAG